MSFKDVSTSLITWVINNHKEDIQVLPMWVMDLGRINEKRPAYLKVAAPDDWVKNVGGVDVHDVYLMIRVPEEHHSTWVNAQSSPDAVKSALGMVESSGVTIGDNPSEVTNGKD